jgi:hypothetical protein
MVRSQSEVSRRLAEARRIGQAESDRHNRLMELEAEAESDLEEGEEGEEGEEEGAGDAASAAVASLSVSDASAAAAAAAAAPPAEEKTAEQLADEADGWETVPKKGGRKGGKK